MRLFDLVIRDTALQVLAWLVVLGALCGATPSSYQTSFPSSVLREAAVAQAADNAATLVLYGPLDSPGLPAQIFMWEMGAYVTIVAAVAGVLLATRLFRGWEADGRLELVRSTGSRPSSLLVASVCWMVLVAQVLAALVGLVTGLHNVDGMSWQGALGFGAVVGVSFLVPAVATAVCAQIVPNVPGCHRAGLGLVLVAFGLRAWGDTYEHSWTSGLSFLGLRDVVAPFTDQRFWVLGAWLGVCLLLCASALLLQQGREYGSALLRPRGGSSRRMRVRGPWSLAVRMGWPSGLTWLLGTGVAAALLTGMGCGAVERARSAPLDGGVLGASLGGDDPALSYVHFQGLLMGALIAVAGICVLQTIVADERSGRVEAILATGRRRCEVVLSRAGWSLLVTLVLCATTALVVGLVAESELGGETDLSDAAWRDVLGQWPAVALIVALATLLVALGTRFFPAAWFIWGAAAFLSLLGEAVDLPDRVIEIGPFEHSPAGNALADFQGSAILMGLALVVLVAAVVVHARRDLHAG
ncbi:MAG: hypothetical protein E7Z97_06440 [Propionibacteriaceae bacterium]|nr:hypothetical protein [Propionibacteriaceae bacterium]